MELTGKKDWSTSIDLPSFTVVSGTDADLIY